MSNDQLYDPRVVDLINRIARNKGLQIAESVSAGNPLITGTFSHGNKVRLSSAISGAFGSKDESPARLWEMGDEQFYAGVANSYYEAKPDGFEVQTYGDDPNSPWEKPSFLGPKIDRTTQRHPYEAWTYRLNDDAGTFLGWHKALGGQETTIQKDALYVSFYRKDSSPFMAFRYRDIGTVSGAGFEFATDQWGVGEPIEVLYAGQTYPGYVVRQLDDNSIEYITSRNILLSGRQTTTITGLNTGTTFTVTSASTTYPAPSSIKIMRVWDASDDTAPQRNRWLSWTSDMVGLGGALNYDDSGSLEVDKWVHYELYIRLLDRVNQIVEIETRIDGEVKHKYEASYDNGTGTFDFTGGYAPNIALLGQDPNRDVNSKSWISNIYADWTAKRVVIGDAPIYADCTFREMQRIDVWNPDYVDFYLNFGALPTGKNLYVFLFDDRNNLIDTIDTGVQL